MFSLIISDINKAEQEGLLTGASGASHVNIKIVRNGKAVVLLVDPFPQTCQASERKYSRVTGKRAPVTLELRQAIKEMRDNAYCELIDIAVKAGCSVQTVRNVLNGKYPVVSSKVVEAVDSLKEGYEAYLTNAGRTDDKYSDESWSYGTNSSGC